MTIDVDDVLSEVDFDEFLAGQVNSGVTLRPKSWDDAKLARQWALDKLLRIFARNRPKLTEDDIDDVTDLKHAIELGAAMRLYFIAIQQAPEPGTFHFLWKTYKADFEAEVQRLIDELLEDNGTVDPGGRGPGVIQLERR